MCIESIQFRLFEMGSVIADIFESNGIPYMLSYGTLLGAIRHQGFIPWDDDFDLMVFDDEYEKAIELLKQKLPADMIVEDSCNEPKYFHEWARVKDLKSEVVLNNASQDNVYRLKGLNVDIYRGYKVKRKDLHKFLYEMNEKYLERKFKYNLITKDVLLEKRRAKEIECNSLKKYLEEEGKDENNFVIALLSFYKCKKMEIDDVFPLKDYCFNGKLFKGPNNPDHILSDIYGEYMELPPIEKQISHYKNVVFL